MDFLFFGCEALGAVKFIRMLDGAVDPAKAEGLFYGIIVAHAFFAGFFHGKYKPYLIIGLKMIFEISSPFLSINRVKQFQKTTT